MDATLVWMSESPLDPNRSYWIKHCTRYLHANIDELSWKLDMASLAKIPKPMLVGLNDIAGVKLSTHSPISFDPYHKDRTTGSFIVIDFMTNQTVAAGMLQGKIHHQVIHSSKERRLRQTGHVLWCKSNTHAQTIELSLNELGHLPILINASDERYPTLEDPTHLCQRLKDAGLLVLLTGCPCPEKVQDISENSADALISELRIRNIIF
jgi:sulfate adenylyltransferase subunit 1 (EFTu-like GTPase family)